MTAVTWMLFDATLQDRDTLDAELEARQQQPARSLLCRHCGHAISTEEQRIEIAGAHSHRCMNPHGRVFEIGCFQQAPGCAAVGPASPEHTWFPGCRWQVGLCSNCEVHIGWRFRGEEAFFGLIHDRLRIG